MGQAMSTSLAEGSPALSRRLEPGNPLPDCTITGLDAIPIWTEAPVSGRSSAPALPCPRQCAVQTAAAQHPLFPSVPTSGAPGRHICLLEVQGVGRAALQDALDVLLEGMLRLGHDAQGGHGQVLVLSGAQQGRGGRVDSASTTQQHRGEQSQTRQTKTRSELNRS